MVKIALKSVECITDNKINILLYVGLDNDDECLEFAKNIWTDCQQYNILKTTTFTELKRFFAKDDWPHVFKNHESDYFPNDAENSATTFIKALSVSLVKYQFPNSTQIPMTFNNN